MTDWPGLNGDNVSSPQRPPPLSRLWLHAGFLVERGRAGVQVTAHRAARHRALNTVGGVAPQALEAFRCVCRQRPVLPINGQRGVTCVFHADEEVEVLLPDLDLGAAASRPEVPDGRAGGRCQLGRESERQAHYASDLTGVTRQNVPTAPELHSTASFAAAIKNIKRSAKTPNQAHSTTGMTILARTRRVPIQGGCREWTSADGRQCR